HAGRGQMPRRRRPGEGLRPESSKQAPSPGSDLRSSPPSPRKRGEGKARSFAKIERAGTLPFARPELAAAVERWLEHLDSERRYSPKTLEAYERDVRQWLAFLAEHLGKKLSLADLEALEPRDVRAF